MLRFAVFLLAIIFCDIATGGEVTSNCPSPDNRHEAIIRTSQEGKGSTVWLKTGAGKEQLLWKSFRPVECHWQPSSRFLAIEDPVGKFCTAVVVFEVRADGTKLIYQTPYSDSEYVLNFQFSKWVDGEDAIEIRIFDDDTHQVAYTYIEILMPARPKPHPNIYTAQH